MNERHGVWHELKTWPEFFEEIVTGRKTFEIRLNDRGFQVGDGLWLREYTVGVGLSGRDARFRVSYMTDWKQRGDHVVLSLQPLASSLLVEEKTPPKQYGINGVFCGSCNVATWCERFGKCLAESFPRSQSGVEEPTPAKDLSALHRRAEELLKEITPDWRQRERQYEGCHAIEGGPRERFRDQKIACMCMATDADVSRCTW